MKTGIFLRVQLDGKWRSYDIADPRVPNAAVVDWINTKSEGDIRFLKRLVMALLGRDMTAIS